MFYYIILDKYNIYICGIGHYYTSFERTKWDSIHLFKAPLPIWYVRGCAPFLFYLSAIHLI